MINFACRTITNEDLLRCSFQLNGTEYKVFLSLLKRGKQDVKTLAEELELERSTVQKSLKTLVEQNLVRKRQLNLENGGYKYVYGTKDKEKIKEEVLELIDKWTRSARESVKQW